MTEFAPPGRLQDYSFTGPRLTSIAAPDTVRPISARRRALRPFGYLTLTVLWLALFAITCAIWAALPTVLPKPLGADGRDSVGAIVSYLVVIIIAALPLGAILLIVTGATMSLVALSALAFSRSLLPSYAAEKLTTTRWSGAGAGPPRIGGAALGFAPLKRIRASRYQPVMNKLAISMIPVRRSRFGSAWASVMFLSLQPPARAIPAMAGIGAAYLLTAGWMLWPATGWAILPWAIVSAALLLWSLRGLTRAIVTEHKGWRQQSTSAL